MDKSNINKALLEQRQEFKSTPAHVFVTKRLYKPHPSVRREQELMNRTWGSPSMTIKETKTQANMEETNAFLSTAYTRNGFNFTQKDTIERKQLISLEDVPRSNFLDINSSHAKTRTGMSFATVRHNTFYDSFTFTANSC